MAKEHSGGFHLNLRLQKGIYHVLSYMGEGQSEGWGRASRKKGRTESIRDLIHRQDNRGRVTKELAVWLALGEKGRAY